jgi:eukaryotic-like serine/threonine-protein kinase
MTRIKQLIHEIHRRSLWQVLAIYAVGAWVAYQVILGLVQGLGLPDWVPAFAIVLFIIGLPIVIATAFVQEGVAGGPAPSADAADGQSDREADAPTGSKAAASEGGRGLRHVLTWRRSLSAGVLAFALLAVAAGTYTGMRALGIGPAGTLLARGLIDAEMPILLADFETTATDPDVGRIVTEALRIDLLQSPAIRVAGPVAVADGLRRMDRDPMAGLPEPVARELAIREGITAVVAGEVGALGGGWVLAARVVSAADGATLVAVRETARDSTELILAVDRLSKRVRERVGESLRSIHAAEPLPRVSTASLPALRSYAQGASLLAAGGDQWRVAELLEEAVALDDGFAMAYRALATLYSQMGADRRRTIGAIRRAYELRDRLPDQEQAFTEAAYYRIVAQDWARASQAYRRILAHDPADGIAYNNMAAMLNNMGEHGQAEEMLRAGIERGSHTFLFTNLIATRYRNRGSAAGLATLDTAIAAIGENPRLEDIRIHILAGEHRWAEAQALAEDMLGRHRDNRHLRITAKAVLFDILRSRGLIEAAAAVRAESDALTRQTGALAPLAANRAADAELAVIVLGDARRAVQEIDTFLADPDVAELPLAAWPVPRMAAALALAGAPARARTLLAGWEAVPTDERGTGGTWLDVAHARIEEAEGRHDAAVERVRDGDGLIRQAELTRLYHATGQVDSARAAAGRYLEARHIERVHIDAIHLAAVLRLLADAHEAAGDVAGAASALTDLVELWRDADPELQPVVDAARRRLAGLAGEH